MSGHVTTTVDSYSWVRPAFPAPAAEAEWAILSPGELGRYLLEELPPQKASFDTETTGLRYWVPGFEMKSLSVFTPAGQGLYATSLVEATDEDRSALLKGVMKHRLYAFNGQFDMGVLVATNRALPKKLRVDEEELLHAFAACSQVLFRHCTNEGFNVHSLEMAQRNLFGWDDGAQKAWLTNALEEAQLSKAEMWRLLEREESREGFLYYNAMDARSAWLVWDHLCSELKRLDREGAIALHEQEFATLIRDCVRQAFTGMPLDRKKMREILISSAKKKAEIHTALRNDERILPFIEQWEKDRIYEQWRLDVERKSKKLSDGKIVSDALAGYAVVDDQAVEPEEAEAEEEGKGITSKGGPAELAPDGQLVVPYYKASLKGGNKFPGFSFSSPDHLKDLLYTHLATYDVAYKKRMGQDEVIRWGINYGGKRYVVAATDSGDLPTGADVYPVFGDIGKKLEEAAEADTRFGFAKSYLAAASETKRIHAQLKVRGAATGRSSGGSGGRGKSSLSVNCFPPSVDILTRRGWVPATEVLQNDEVWTVNMNSLQGHWEVPSAVVKYGYEGNLVRIGGRRGGIVCTPDHRILWTGDRRHECTSVHNLRWVLEAERGTPNRRGFLPLSGVADECVTHTSEEIWKVCAAQADGSWYEWAGKNYSFGFRRQRKIDMMIKLFGEEPVVYESKGKTTVHFKVKLESNLLKPGKEKLLDLSGLGGAHADDLATALAFWDGNSRATGGNARVYWTNEYRNADEVQRYLCRNGYEARLQKYTAGRRSRAPSYCVSFRKLGQLTVRGDTDITLTPYVGEVGCVTNSTGFILIRSEGQCFVTGQCQQLPRSDREFMECFVAPKGMYYLSNDFKSLELVVQAELSGDPVLTRLYASGEKHDPHLFHTMKIHPNPKVREAIGARYTTEEKVLDALKKEFKKERSLGKTFGFALSYQSGAENLMLKAAIEGFPITIEEAETSKALYRALYTVYYAWCEEKKKEWAARGGWIEDGFGYPIAIAPYPLDRQGYPTALKDAGSKVVQSTGHYILMTWLKHIEAIKRERNLWKLEQPVICDLHDERIVLTPDPEACNALHLEALARVNEELSPKIKFEIASEWGPTLYDCKKG